MAEHTPWRAAQDEDGLWDVLDAQDDLVAFGMTEEHAKKLAAVDDLLAALKPFADLADEIEECCKLYKDEYAEPENWFKACQWEDLTAARAAIAKARGQ